MEKLEILVANLGNYYQNNEEYLFYCPKCKHEKKKLSINLQKDVFKCWVCSYSGKSVTRLVKDFLPSSQYLKWLEVTSQVDITRYDDLFSEHLDVPPEILNLPMHFKSLSSPNKGENLRPLQYLYGRGITDLDILRWKIGFCDYGEYAGRIIVPSFDDEGRLNYFVGRSYYEDSYKYKNPKCSKDIIFNDVMVDWDSDIVLVEGVFDAIKAENAIPLLGSSLREGSVLFEKITNYKPNIYLALDTDADEKAYKISNTLRQYDIETYKIDAAGYDDVGEMSKEEFLNRKSNASFLTPADYLMYKINF